MVRIDDILEAVSSYHPSPNLALIQKAYVYSAKVHQGQTRASGEPYLIHPLEVAAILAQLKLDEASIATGLLHDTVEDTLATSEEIQALFGQEVCELVDGVTKLSKLSFSNKEDQQAENFRKMLVAMSKDLRVILVKLADRMHNMRTLDFVPIHKRERVATETMEIYAPLANRLGMNWVKTELEDLAFKHIRPKEYEELLSRVASAHEQKQSLIDEVKGTIQKRLGESSIPAVVYGRIKHLYSIYKKMRAQSIDIDQIYDIWAFRVLVNNVSQCYETLGHVHTLWRPIPGRFKDYIAMPKPNMYQSLHTTVIGPGGERVEIQIRTQEMHAIAEEGVAAHWVYKEGVKGGPKPKGLEGKSEAQFAWLRQLMEWQQELSDPTEFIDTVKVDLFSDEVFVFTPKGKVVPLKQGSCPIDFAFAIHSQVGLHCIGARVNGKMVPLKHTLKNGDTVEVLTSANQWPSKDWLGFVKSARAKSKIRVYIRTEERKLSHELGRELLDKELRRIGKTLSSVMASKELQQSMPDLKCTSQDELFIQLGYGKMQAAQICQTLFPRAEPAADAPSKVSGQEVLNKVARRASPSGVVIHGVNDVLVQFAKCCSPLPGDRIVGFVTRGRGITIHAYQCARAIDMDPERRVEVLWDQKTKFTRPVTVRVHTIDKPGILATLSQLFSDRGVNISQANCRVTSDNRAVNTFEVAVGDSDQLRGLIHVLERLEGVLTVERAG